ncbi:MAG: hypothetical protein LHV68_01670 [Elusimicrobia bacterium]|nr:hypothetical protein [Candidatus Liberimonas magnetica]
MIKTVGRAIMSILMPVVLFAAEQADIMVNFTPDYPSSGGSQEVFIAVNFTPDYQPPAPADASITVSFTPSYQEVVESSDTFVSISYSSATLNGEPVSLSIVVESTTTSRATVALAQSEGSGLLLASSLYDIGPDSAVFSPASNLVFRYNEPLPEGTTEQDLYVYRWDEPSTGWLQLTQGLVRNTNENWISVEVAELCLFAVFAPNPDITPPLISFVYPSPDDKGVQTIYNKVIPVKFSADDQSAGKWSLEYRLSGSTESWVQVTSGTIVQGGGGFDLRNRRNRALY